MSNLNFAGPTKDDNVTLAQTRDYINRLAILFPKNPATIKVFGLTAFPSPGNWSLMDQVFTEQDLLDAGVDPNTDPVEVTLEFAGAIAPHQWAAAIGRRLNMGRLNDYQTIATSIFGRDDSGTGYKAYLDVTMANIANNPATVGKKLWQVMQGR